MPRIIVPGTTPVHEWFIPFQEKDIKSLLISYGQNDLELFVKEKKDCTFSENTVSVQLTQKETLQFLNGTKAQAQLNVVNTNGDRFTTVCEDIDVDTRILHPEVIE